MNFESFSLTDSVMNNLHHLKDMIENKSIIVY